MSSTKFMTFPNAKDDTSTDFTVKIHGFANFPDNATIVAVVGKARSGKSTFLNAMLFELGIVEAGNLQFREKDLDKRGGIFKTGSTGSQVTRGIDCFLVKTPKKNYLFMDVQGIMEGNAGFDHGLLMAAYTMCDVFIYSQPNTVTHELFGSLIPMASFLPCVSADRKPVMILRLFDRSLDSEKADLDKCFHELTNPTIKDNFTTIRTAINQLFSEHHIVQSCPLNLNNKSRFKTLKDLMRRSDDYEPESYQAMITNTINIIQNMRTHSHSEFTERSRAIEAQINKCKVDLTKCDALLNKNRLDLMDDMTVITGGENNPIITTEDSKVSTSGSRCDGFSIAEIIKRRKQQYDDYVKKFNTVAESVRTPEFSKLHRILFDKINELANTNRANAWKSANLSARIKGRFGICPNNTYNAPDFNIDAHLAEADKYDICVRDALVASLKSQLKVYKGLIEEHTDRMTKINKKMDELHDAANNQAAKDALEKRSTFSKLATFVSNLFTNKQRDLLTQINDLGPYYCDINIYWNNGSYACDFNEIKIKYNAEHFKLTENIDAVQKARYNDIKNNYYKSIPGKLHEYLGDKTPTYIVHHLEGLTEMYNLARTFYANQGISMAPPHQYEAHGRQYYSKIQFTGKHSGFEAIYEQDFIKYLMKSSLVYSEL